MKITDLPEYVEHFRMCVLQDALHEATTVYWTKRATQFAGVGTARCDEIAQACRNRASLGLGVETPHRLSCPACGTYISPWSCSCGQTRIGGLDDVA